MWDAGKQKHKQRFNTNKELAKLTGELDEDTAKVTLAKFLFDNPGFAIDLLTNGDLTLYPFQEIIIKGWMRNDFSMFIAGRGLGKSYLCAIFCFWWALFNPNNRIVLVSFAFRATRRILEQVEKFVNMPGSIIIKNCFPKDIKKGNDEWTWLLPNGASIKCMPLGDGTKIRGTRADTVIIDEKNFINAKVITEVIQPFLVSSNNINEQMKITALEDELIKKGLMKEEDRTVLDENVKVISLSSAGYQFEDMYKEYTANIAKIQGNEVEKIDERDAKYFVARMSYEAAPDGLVNKKIIEEAQNGQTSQAIFDKEYRAIFVPDSGSYFSAKKMQECTIPNGESPCIELVGEKGACYVLAIDPSFSNAEHSDYFAFLVLKMIRKGDKTVPMVVHNYMMAGGDLRDHHIYFAFLLKNFNIEYIAVDASQGDNEFITSANNSKLFKENGIQLLDIEADFGKETNLELAKQIRQSYNKTAGRIIHKQHFGAGGFQRSANEHLQACIDYKNIVFAAKIAAHPTESQGAADVDFSMLREHTFFKDMSPNDIIEHQDMLMDKLKQQCALIELSVSGLGSQQWDLPLAYRRSKSPDRMRKDGYSALILGNWASKLFVESQSLQVEDVPQTFTPFEV
jgi:hypothetical protein